MIDKLVALLSSTRASDYSHWMKVGWLLHNVTSGSDDGLAVWCKFSARCGEKFCEVECMTVWARIVPHTHLNMGSLHHWAEQDSPHAYAKLTEPEIESIVAEDGEKTQYVIAKFIRDRYGYRFVCTDRKQDHWYECRAGIWCFSVGAIGLDTLVSEDVARAIYEVEKNVAQRQTTAFADAKSHIEFLKSDEKRKKRVAKLNRELQTRPFKKHVLAEAGVLLYDGYFVRRLDINPFTVAFRNGLYDLKTNTFRQIEAGDYVATVLPVDYLVCTQRDSRLVALCEFFAHIFPDPTVRSYFMDVYSEIFVGGNPNKHIYFWTGFGNNGKSVTQALFDRMLGPMGIKISTLLFTGKKVNLGVATPELARTKPPTRLITLDEPDSREKLNIGLLKQMSGNDAQWCRDLWQAGSQTYEFTPLYKITFICNKLPAICNGDEATFERIRVIPFESRFLSVEKCPEGVEERRRLKIFPANTNLANEMGGLAEVFAYYLLEWRKARQGKALIEPAKVTAATTHYRQRNDLYFQFVSEMLVFDSKTKPALSLAAVTAMFCFWYKTKRLGGAGEAPDATALLSYFENKWGEERSGWPSMSEISLDEMVSQGRVVLSGMRGS
jgi:phage/plasmid-associated DNA primase